jgi:hypothetical protein
MPGKDFLFLSFFIHFLSRFSARALNCILCVGNVFHLLIDSAKTFNLFLFLFFSNLFLCRSFQIALLSPSFIKVDG